MTFKTLFVLLILFICLAWVGAFYFHSDSIPALVQFGLRWTAIGIIAAFAYIVGSHLYSWWRRRRARAPAQPKAATPKPTAPLHEDDATLVTLIAEANTALEKAPGYAGKAGAKPVYSLPWYLLVGPEGSGKTSTFLNSGVEPQLLAGQVIRTGPVVPTRICNLWLAKNCIFAEISGKAFNGDLGRWTQLLSVLRGTESVPLWKRLLGKGPPALMLRGVIAVSDVREFTGASADPQRFERYCRNWQERLRAIAEVFGEFPVYQVITKCDEIAFFKDFFHRLPESDTGQVLGTTFPLRQLDATQPGEVFAEAEAKRLTKAFRLLYQALAERRLTHLAYETDSSRRPAIYEFPRELKRIRSPLVQFLTDAFRPDALRQGPLLRGYYLTAMRETEAVEATPATITDDWQTLNARPRRAEDATRMFDFGNTLDNSSRRERPKHTTLRWSFVTELFHAVILGDQPLESPPPVDARTERLRRLAFAGVCGFCGLLCLIFLVSWLGNRGLVHDVEAAATARIPKPADGLATTADLRNLDALRAQVERLRNGPGLSLHWGLYSGNAIEDPTRTAYFRRFQQVLLTDLNRTMVDQLKTLPSPPRPDDPYDPVYQVLQTHLKITDKGCTVDREVVASILKDVRGQIGPKNDSQWEATADRQIDFYASELAYGNPAPSSEDLLAVAHARDYLWNVTGIDRHYRKILATVEKTLTKPLRLADSAPNYAQVLKSDPEPSPAFSADGWKLVREASKGKNPAAAGDPCVLGKAPEGSAKQDADASLAPGIERLFVRDYIDRWKRYLEAFSVLPYNSADDGAGKLKTLADNRSPLLALFAMISDQTNFLPEQAGGLQKLVEDAGKKIGTAVGGIVKTEPKPTGPTATVTDITDFFQPVHVVVPPGSSPWVGPQNSAYIDALSQLRTAMQDVAASDAGSDLTARQTARQNAKTKYNDAERTVDQLARAFELRGLDLPVKELLHAPIRNAEPFTRPAREPGPEGPLALLCKNLKPTFEKYPFKASSTADVSASELSMFFSPEGEIWKLSKQPAFAGLTGKENGEWKSKDPARQVTPELLRFLNRAQQITNAFFAGGGNQPRITYALLPRKLDSRFPPNSILELQIDGKPYQWTTALRKELTWPPPSDTKDLGADAGIRTGAATYPFDSRVGLWGIFRIFGAAEERMLLANPVVWKYSHAGGRAREIEPAPVLMDIVEFPGGQDVFNPKFFENFQCPTKAVK